MTDFNHQTLDRNLDAAPLPMIGERYRHTGNGHVYTIVGVAWSGATDEWALIHTREGNPVPCVRTVNNFMGLRSNGDVRFIQEI